MTFIVQSYFDTLLRYVLSVTFCGAVVSVKVGAYNRVFKHLENLPDTSSQIFDWKQFTRHSFSLFGGISFSRERMFYESNESLSHESRVNESMSQI